MPAIPASAVPDASADPGTARSSVPPDQDRAEFERLHASVTSDWGPRDSYERRWVMELVSSLWRQDRLRRLELAVMAAAEQESPASEASVRKLLAFARYGARIDKDIGRALQALRVLRDRPDAWIDELQDGTSEPARSEPGEQRRTDSSLPRTHEPDPPLAQAVARTGEPERPLNRRERRALAALQRRRAA
jgi:hypothetical protein